MTNNIHLMAANTWHSINQSFYGELEDTSWYSKKVLLFTSAAMLAAGYVFRELNRLQMYSQRFTIQEADHTPLKLPSEIFVNEILSHLSEKELSLCCSVSKSWNSSISSAFKLQITLAQAKKAANLIDSPHHRAQTLMEIVKIEGGITECCV